MASCANATRCGNARSLARCVHRVSSSSSWRCRCVACAREARGGTRGYILSRRTNQTQATW
eukprot:7393240-Pyramimonas_sp.AAC.1